MHDPAKYHPTERFGDRVGDYARARPGYPPEAVAWMLRAARLAPAAAVADLGSGTGLFARELLAAGCVVHAVEPNAAMRAEAERRFAAEPRFRSHAASAEQTGLPARSVALVCAAQAFHWFEPKAARAELLRILVPGGAAALVWNIRRIDSAFARDYEALLLSHCPAYAEGQPHQAAPAEIAAYLDGATIVEAAFAQAQRFDHEGLQARLLSSSYTPKADDPARAPLLGELRALFARHAQDGRVRFEYDTRVHVGCFNC